MSSWLKTSFLILAIVGGAVVGQAQPADDIGEKYEEVKRGLVKDEEAKRKVLSELYKVTHHIRKIQRRRDDLVFERNRTAQRVEEAGKKIEVLEEKLNTSRDLIAHRMRALYKFSDQGPLRLIFSSRSMNELDRNFRLIKRVTARDVAIFDKHKRGLTLYAEKKRRLKIDLRRLSRLEREIGEQEDELIAQQEAQSRILESFDEATLARLQRLEKLRHLSQASGHGSLQAAFFERKGKLGLPVKGALRQAYGVVSDPTNGVKLRFKGNYYEAPKGTEVSNIHSGEVSFADWVEGYGPTAIVSHGDHYYTVYGGLSRLHVKVGDRVRANEVLGEVGSSYYLFGSGLYFEIRHFSDPVDPADWLELTGRHVSQLSDENGQ